MNTLNSTRSEELAKSIQAVANQESQGAGNQCAVPTGRVDASGRSITKTRAMDTTHKFSTDVSGLTGGVVTLNEGLTARKKGQNTFDGRQVNGQSFSIDAVAVRVDTAGVAGLANGSAQYNDAAPGQLLNSNLILEQDGRQLFNIPFIDLVNNVEAENTSEFYRALSTSPVLVKDVEFNINLETADGATIPADTLVSILFRGHLVK